MIMAAGLVFLAALMSLSRDMAVLLLEATPVDGPPFPLIGFVSLHPRVLQKILNWVLVRLNREPISLSASSYGIFSGY